LTGSRRGSIETDERRRRTQYHSLGRHAIATTRIAGNTRHARSLVTGLAQRSEQLAVCPHHTEFGDTDVARCELLVNDERTGVEIADGIDEEDQTYGAAEIQPLERTAQRREEEERVSGLDAGLLELPLV
jgi:hypothetical protein